MPDLSAPGASPEWPRQLRAAGALALIGVVWLLVLPVAAGACLGLELAARLRGHTGPRQMTMSPGRARGNRAAPSIGGQT